MCCLVSCPLFSGGALPYSPPSTPISYCRNFLGGHLLLPQELLQGPVLGYVHGHFVHLSLHLRHCGIEDQLEFAATVPPTLKLRPHLQQRCGPPGAWCLPFVLPDVHREVLRTSRPGFFFFEEGSSGTPPCTSTRTLLSLTLAVFWPRGARWCKLSARAIARLPSAHDEAMSASVAPCGVGLSLHCQPSSRAAIGKLPARANEAGDAPGQVVVVLIVVVVVVAVVLTVCCSCRHHERRRRSLRCCAALQHLASIHHWGSRWGSSEKSLRKKCNLGTNSLVVVVVVVVWEDR